MWIILKTDEINGSANDFSTNIYAMQCCCSEVQCSWWRNQMETISALLSLCEGNPPVTSGFPSQKLVTRSFDVLFDLRLNNDWANIETPVIWDAIALIMTSLWWADQFWDFFCVSLLLSNVTIHLPKRKLADKIPYNTTCLCLLYLFFTISGMRLNQTYQTRARNRWKV